MGFGSFLKKVINPLSPIKGILGAGKAIAKGDFKNAARQGLGASLGFNIGAKKAAPRPGWGAPPGVAPVAPGMPQGMPPGMPGSMGVGQMRQVQPEAEVSGWGAPAVAMAQAPPQLAPAPVTTFDYEDAKARFGVGRAREMQADAGF